MSLTQLTERARVPRAQVFGAIQRFLDPLAPKFADRSGVVEKVSAYGTSVASRQASYTDSYNPRW